MPEPAEQPRFNYDSFAIKQAQDLILHGANLAIESGKIPTESIGDVASLLATIVGVLEEEAKSKGGE